MLACLVRGHGHEQALHRTHGYQRHTVVARTAERSVIVDLTTMTTMITMTTSKMRSLVVASLI